MFAPEARKARTPLEEVGEGSVEIEARLLQRVPVEASKPGVLAAVLGDGEKRFEIVLGRQLGAVYAIAVSF